MKAIWKGSISFGLVSIPVHLYSAISSQSLGFKLLHGKCHTAINYLRWCPKCKIDVKWEDIVKGMPVKDGGYIVLTKEKLEELKPEKSDLIEIAEFVALDQLSPIFQDDHYYLLP
ncbi:MAG: Ku protein, partial [Bacteroidota bacterium]